MLTVRINVKEVIIRKPQRKANKTDKLQGYWRQWAKGAMGSIMGKADTGPSRAAKDGMAGMESPGIIIKVSGARGIRETGPQEIAERSWGFEGSMDKGRKFDKKSNGRGKNKKW